MTVSSFHRDYLRRIDNVKKMRALIACGEAVREYIETLPGHSDTEKELYRKKAYYLPAVPRTIDAFVGMIMNPVPKVTGAPKQLTDLLNDVTNNGEPLSRVASKVVREVVTSARMFALVDYPQADPGTTKAQAEKLGHRPYVRLYPFEDFFNWTTENINGRQMLTHARLVETYSVEGVDEWDTYEEEQIRVLDIHEGRYRQRVYRRKDTAKNRATDRASSRSMVLEKMRAVAASASSIASAADWEQYGDDIYPMRGGKHLEEIPGVVFGPDSLDPAELDKPPLLEMADISISHLNNSASREWALMWCGAPTLVIAGEPATDADGKPLPIKVGSSQAIVLGEGGNASLLQMGSEAVGAIKDSMADKRTDMAAVGARILIDSGSSQISTETAHLERVGEHSVLAEIALSASDGLTKLIRHLAEWAGIKLQKTFGVVLNTDFVPTGLQSGELTEWVQALQSGALPLALFLDRLKSRGVAPADMTEEEYKRQILEDSDELGFGSDEPEPEDEDQDENEEDEEGDADAPPPQPSNNTPPVKKAKEPA